MVGVHAQESCPQLSAAVHQWYGFKPSQPRCCLSAPRRVVRGRLPAVRLGGTRRGRRWRKPAHVLVDCHAGWLARGSHRNPWRLRTAASAPYPSQFLARAPQRSSARRDLLPMVYDLDLAVMVAIAGIAAVAAVYLWSKIPAAAAGPGGSSSSFLADRSQPPGRRVASLPTGWLPRRSPGQISRCPNRLAVRLWAISRTVLRSCDSPPGQPSKAVLDCPGHAEGSAGAPGRFSARPPRESPVKGQARGVKFATPKEGD